MATKEKKPSKRKRRVKFLLSRRERLKELSPEDYTTYQPGSLSRLASLHSVIDNGFNQYGYQGDGFQPYSQPSIGDLDDMSMGMSSRGYFAPHPAAGRWQHQQYFGGEVEMPLAANEQSWAVIDPNGGIPPDPHVFNDSQLPLDRDAADGMAPSEAELSPSSRVMFAKHKHMRRYDSEAQPGDGVSFRSGKLQSESDSVFEDIKDMGMRPPRMTPIRETDSTQARSLIRWGPEIATPLELIWPMLGILGYLIDVGSDVLLAIEYYSVEHYWWFILTLSFVFIPSIAMTIFSLILWVRNSSILKDKVSWYQWLWRALSLILLVSPICRMLETLYYGYQSRNSTKDWYHRRQYYERMLDENTDCMLVRLFETFLENAPQLVLQLYVVSQLGTKEGLFLVMLQITGLVTSWLAMTWSLVSFNTALRDSLPDKARMTLPGKITMFFWRLFTIAARVTALALFASHYHFYVLVFAAAHFAVMFVWMARQQTVYCQFRIKEEDGTTKIHHSEFLEFCFRAMAAFVHIFCFINLLEGHSRLRCLVYYSVVYCENIVLILFWYIPGSATTTFSWYHTPAMIAVALGFFIGIFFQLIYYKCCHPNNFSPPHKDQAIRWCVPCSELSMFNGLSFPEEPDVIYGTTAEKEPLSNEASPIYKPNRVIELQPRVTTGGDSLPRHQGSLQSGRGIDCDQMSPLGDSQARAPSRMSLASQASMQSGISHSSRFGPPGRRQRYAQNYTNIKPKREKEPLSPVTPDKPEPMKSTEV